MVYLFLSVVSFFDSLRLQSTRVFREFMKEGIVLDGWEILFLYRVPFVGSDM